MKYTVTFLPDEKSVEVEDGARIAEAAQKAEVFINNLCGGEGVCGQCIASGYVLACQTEIHDNLEITIPPETRMEEAKIMTGEAAGVSRSEDDKPLVRKIYLELPPPTLEDNIADIERVSRELRRKIGWHSFDIHLECLKGLPEKLRDNDWKVTVTLARDRDRYRIQRIEPLDTTNRNYGVAIDVGTTTVVAQLVDIRAGEVLGVEGSHNLQASYGEDVISRMIYACGRGGLPPLHEAIIKNINQLIEKLVEKHNVSKEDINAIVAAGNTTMSHFLLGLTPCSIRLEPYVPTADEFPQVRARDLGIQVSSNGFMETIPCVASYVGGDIVAGVMSCGIADHPEVRGLIDIGTNGEIAIGNNEWLVCCSASAGPAFEGGGTRCGMRAIKGAIEKIEIIDGDIKYETIGNAPARGICGSGLIDCIYELVRNGIIGAEGKFDRELKHERFGIEDDIPQYTIAPGDQTETGEPVVITESDIDNLMKSKGAVFAAIKSLTDYIGLSFDQIETFYVAGGFGSFLNIPKAIAIGLLPDIPQEKIQFIGNSSLTGARRSLLSENAFEKCINISRSMTNIELSNYQPFMDEYIAALFLPHTDRKLFPSVQY
ncbi:MAG: hypothetical protein B1H13_01530 [Desulfobacteraceae bacterium 4484_190.3]|nr:MAG: hypothetical protein B1H13_01530 [Desulfobacteraceae bacterium 4484_190.3]